jgi:hypothetical protein
MAAFKLVMQSRQDRHENLLRRAAAVGAIGGAGYAIETICADYERSCSPLRVANCRL